MSLIVIDNYNKDKRYCPYCLRCSGLHRMELVEPYYWKHHCGAECDLRNMVMKNRDMRILSYWHREHQRCIKVLCYDNKIHTIVSVEEIQLAEVQNDFRNNRITSSVLLQFAEERQKFDSWFEEFIGA